MMIKSVLTAALTGLAVMVPSASVLGPATMETAEAACVKAPTWAPQKTRLGVSLNVNSGSRSTGEDLKVEESRFGTRINVVRTFDTGMPNSTWAQRTSWFGTRWNSTSIKLPPREVNSGKYDSALRNYFSTMPKTSPIFFTYYHEPEDEVKSGQFTATDFRTAWKRIINIAAGSCNPNLFPTLILMGWTAEPASKLNWKDYYPGADYVSVLGWDPYNGAHGDATSYKDPSTLFDNPVAKSSAAGKPWAITETGSDRIPGDTYGSGRAAWLTKVANYAKYNKAVFLTYFQSTNNGDFELRKDPEIGTWRKAMSS
jgi:hypothetical protein